MTASTALWTLFFAFCYYLPWTAVFLGAAYYWWRRGKTHAVLLQIAGAGGTLTLGIANDLVRTLLMWMGASIKVLTASMAIFGFLLFLAMGTFAIGFCMEKLGRQPEARGFPVTATPVER